MAWTIEIKGFHRRFHKVEDEFVAITPVYQKGKVINHVRLAGVMIRSRHYETFEALRERAWHLDNIYSVEKWVELNLVYKGKASNRFVSEHWPGDGTHPDYNFLYPEHKFLVPASQLRPLVEKKWRQSLLFLERNR
jgi:hypothetical protein